jgi:hypothetical protein
MGELATTVELNTIVCERVVCEGIPYGHSNTLPLCHNGCPFGILKANSAALPEERHVLACVN